MHYFAAVAVAAASFLSLTSAVPTKRSSSLEAGFKVEQVANPNFSGRHGPSHLAKAANKYGFDLPSKTTVSAFTSAVSAAIAGVNSTAVGASPVGLNGEIDEFLSPVTIGGQQFNLDFDTGSSDLWVAGPGLQASATYNPTSSPLAGQSWSIQYGDGTTASGDVFSDTVTIGGATVTGQAVERAKTAGSRFFRGGSDGLLGLAFSSDNTVKPKPVKTWFDNAVAQGLPAVFAVNLAANGPGSYDFGMVDNSAFQGQLAYAEVDPSSSLWMFEPDGGDRGIVDTGTSLILLPEESVQNYYAGTGATFDEEEGGYTYDCNTILPDFTITIAGYQATVPGQDINFAPVNQSACYGGIQASDSISFAIYGDVFLKSQYVVFDRRSSTPQLGFAAKAS